jgi:aminoglycoside phosphotransferase (APT) family kinase protein
MDGATISAELAPALIGRRDVREIVVEPHPYRTSHWLAALEVGYADGSSESLVLKDLGSLGEARPAFVHDPLREIDVYRRLLPGARLGTASFRGAVVDPSLGRFWLVIERVRATELWQIGSFESWLRAAGWLAEMHVRLKDAESEHLTRWTREYIGTWIARARALSRDAAVVLAARRAAELTERILALPAGFVHGELYPSNVLVDEPSGRVCAIDWEMAGVGPLLLDLAALTSGNWNERERRQLTDAYWRGANTTSSFDELVVELDVCRLLVALQWLGWSRRWTPPPEHAHDWLADVRMLVEEVGLA